MLEILRDPNTQWILLGTLLLGLSSGVIGSFAYLRKQSLLGDTLAHAALPGICIVFMLTGVKSISFFLFGAAIAGMIAVFVINVVTKYSRIKQDTALGLVLSAFFGLGIVLLTQIQQSSYGNQSGLDKFLFGQTASMVMSDVYVMMAVSLILILACTLFFKEFKLLSFDPGFAKGIGLPVLLLDYIIMLLIVGAVVIGIQAVGVVLMAALLITPAVSARYWTERLSVMVVLSGIFGMLSGVVGTLLSAAVNNLPTGPLIVLSATVWFMFSLLFAPNRGVVAKLWRRVEAKRKYELIKKLEKQGAHHYE
ncbi:metal ABC transporter permease [Peribacillus asahii]|uniref:Manganese transport system membrane protein MntC n=2 Tax=Peribacillus asahii TaxID=228899 RepID=A0A398B4R3_9BACI|nr:iron chelate uptake ABC transporter family permease subunit [Peribacillus asahii]RID82766.1 metal ABC transporter permease [Peribacillus asahii]